MFKLKNTNYQRADSSVPAQGIQVDMVCALSCIAQYQNTSTCKAAYASIFLIDVGLTIPVEASDQDPHIVDRAGATPTNTYETALAPKCPGHSVMQLSR
jgi:hypothetical protein